MSFNPLEKVLYQEGLLLTAQLCETEQNYTQNTLRNQNMALFNSGVIQGLQATGASQSTTITVSAGIALDTQGRQLLLLNATTIPVPANINGTAYIYMQYQEIYPNQSGGLSNIIIEQGQIQIAANMPTDPHLLLGTVSIQNGVLAAAVVDARTYITSTIPLSKNIPSIVTYPFSVSISAPSNPNNSTEVNTFTLTDFPTNLNFNSIPQILVSVQDNASTSQGGFFASVSNVQINPFSFKVNILWIGTTGSWTEDVTLNCLAWEAGS